MYLPIESQRTYAIAWLEAATAVNAARGHEAHNVVIDVAEPLVQTPADDHIATVVDDFLRSQGALPLQSVANTIFPERLYRRHGAPDFYDVYQRVYDVVRKRGDWGRYFERMVRRLATDGEVINPLANLVGKMRQHVHGDGKTFRNIYELALSDPELDMAIYDPERDAGPVMNRQCLSFLSFKLDRDNRLILTAMYRNHYYVERLLGNLIGLARLMAFIGEEAEVEIGPLTVVSTHALIDTPKECRRAEVDRLLAACAEAREAVEAA